MKEKMERMDARDSFMLAGSGRRQVRGRVNSLNRTDRGRHHRRGKMVYLALFALFASFLLCSCLLLYSTTSQHRLTHRALASSSSSCILPARTRTHAIKESISLPSLLSIFIQHPSVHVFFSLVSSFAQSGPASLFASTCLLACLSVFLPLPSNRHDADHQATPGCCCGRFS